MIKYPVSGSIIGDDRVLDNAVTFTTAQRASAAARTLKQPLEDLEDLDRAILAVEGFERLMVSTEDAVGWLFALRDWQPGTAHGSLFALLDTIQVGRRTKKEDWSEAAARQLLEGLDADGFRRHIHIPEEVELKSAGWMDEDRDMIERAMQAQLEGFRRIVSKRGDKNRALVKAYNKAKHLILGMLTKQDGKIFVMLQSSKTGYSDPTRGIVLEGAWLGCEKADIMRRANETLQIQAVLNFILTLVLWTRYGERIPSAPWVVDFYEHGGWPD